MLYVGLVSNLKLVLFELLICFISLLWLLRIEIGIIISFPKPTGHY
uniref:Uncharacterized protein n=1 Tax=Arundo donax TaxID=35708 RepID=A0A0A9C4S8_ARUDO